MNRAFGAWIGVPPESLLGLPWTDLFESASAEELGRLASTGWVGLGESRFALRDGRYVALVVTIAPDGSEWIAFHDATARQRLDEAIDQQHRMEAVAELAAGVSRELNDPMSIVQGRLELLLALGPRADLEAMTRHIEVALEHARRVAATLRNLRLLGRASSGLAAVAVEDAVTEALTLLGPRAGVVEIAYAFPGIQAAGDLAMIARVLANLVRRVLDVSPRHARISVRRGREEVEIEIAPGVGWAAREREQRPPGSSFDADVIDRTLLASVGAEVHRSGAGWAVVLPLPPVPRARTRRAEARLVVAGSAELVQVLEGLVSREGYDVVRARNANEALSALGPDPTDALVTELFLEGASGLALAGEALRRTPGLRVLLVSEVRLTAPPAGVAVVHPPLQRGRVLEALGRKVRRS
jgi:CheY-like chemotaxis protein